MADSRKNVNVKDLIDLCETIRNRIPPENQKRDSLSKLIIELNKIQNDFPYSIEAPVKINIKNIEALDVFVKKFIKYNYNEFSSDRIYRSDVPEDNATPNKSPK